MNISCIILAGGEGKRMDGADKGLALYNGRALIASVINKIKNQVDDIVISANRNIERYEAFGYPVITDAAIADENFVNNTANQNYNGPLAGIAAAFSACNHDWVFIIACDMPLISQTLVAQLVAGLKHDDGIKTNIVIAEANEKFQLAMLLNKKLLPSLEQSLSNNELKLMQWVKSNKNIVINFAATDEFKNFNYFKDLQ